MSSCLLLGGLLGCDSHGSNDSQLAASANGSRTFYVDSESGSDDLSGTSLETAWKSLKKINSMEFVPGDTIRLKRGSIWGTGLIIRSSGTADAPITVEAYGDEDKRAQDMNSPIIENPDAGKWGIGVELQGSHIIVDGLFIRNAFYKGIAIQNGANHNIIRHNEITNVGIGVQAEGQFNLITRNYVHDLHMVVNTPAEAGKPKSGKEDFGANCFWLGNTDNEISYNRGENCIAPSFDYKTDGGFVELFGKTDRSHIHHNFVKNTDSFTEIGGPGGFSVSHQIRMHHNVLVDVKTPSLCVHNSVNSKIYDVRFENNTVYKTKGGGYPQIACMEAGAPEGTLLLRNNLFVSDVRISLVQDFTHQNNLYNLLNGAILGFDLDSSEKLADAGFFAAEADDFRLAEGSLAINLGKELGYEPQYPGRAPRVGAPDAGAYEYGSNIVVYAAGQAADGSYPTMRLLIDDVPVATWNDVKGDAVARKFVAFSYDHPKTVDVSRVKIEFVNDGGRDGGRNLRLDMIKIDGKHYHTEADTTYSTSCTAGYQKSEWLYCNGSVAFKK